MHVTAWRRAGREWVKWRQPTGAASEVFVGRDAHLSQIADIVGRVRDGEPWLVVIDGESVIGKSVLGRRGATLAKSYGLLAACCRPGRGGSGLRHRATAAPAGGPAVAGRAASARWRRTFRGVTVRRRCRVAGAVGRCWPRGRSSSSLTTCSGPTGLRCWPSRSRCGGSSSTTARDRHFAWGSRGPGRSDPPDAYQHRSTPEHPAVRARNSKTSGHSHRRWGSPP